MNNPRRNWSPGYSETLTLILGTLKLTGLIGWSWWLVLSPMVVIPALFFLAGFIYQATVDLAKHRARHNPTR